MKENILGVLRRLYTSDVLVVEPFEATGATIDVILAVGTAIPGRPGAHPPPRINRVRALP